MPLPRAPRFSDLVDIDAHIRLLPLNATCKGFFFTGVLDLARKAAPDADLLALAGLQRRRYVPFLDYPYAEILRLLSAGAQLLYPAQPHGEGLRRLGHRAYDMLFGTHFGRMLFGVLGSNVERALALSPKAFSFALNFGTLVVNRIGDCHVRYEYRNLPILLETYQMGVIEGGMHHFCLNPSLRIELRDLANATVDIRWTYLVATTSTRGPKG